MSSDIEITIGEVSDVEARIGARYCGPVNADEAGPIVLRGSLRGPYCDNSRTLPAEFAFRAVNSEASPTAEAVVPDPCLWSAELSHLYRVDLEALQGGRVIAEYHGTIGLRRLSPRLPVDFAPGTG